MCYSRNLSDPNARGRRCRRVSSLGGATRSTTTRQNEVDDDVEAELSHLRVLAPRSRVPVLLGKLALFALVCPKNQSA